MVGIGRLGEIGIWRHGRVLAWGRRLLGLLGLLLLVAEIKRRIGVVGGSSADRVISCWRRQGCLRRRRFVRRVAWLLGILLRLGRLLAGPTACSLWCLLLLLLGILVVGGSKGSLFVVGCV